MPDGFQEDPKQKEKPEANLELEYVYGYRCHDARNNLKYTQEGKIVFHAAGVGIVMDQNKNTQSFMFDHDDDIQCLATDPTGEFCVTG